MQCPKCRAALLNLDKLSCSICKFSMEWGIKANFLSSLEEQETKNLLLMIACRGKILDASKVINKNRNATAAILGSLRDRVLEKAKLFRDDPYAKMFIEMCESVDRNEEQDES